MKNLIIAANWKSNKTKEEARIWIEEFSQFEIPENIEVIILAPYTLLDMLSAYIKVNSLKIKLGSQDISPFDHGPYTGEISSEQIKEFADYVLVGHSERRSNLGESNDMVNKKIEKAKKAGLKEIVCISGLEQAKSLSSDDLILAYEPPGSISTSGPNAKPKDPKLVSDFVLKLKEFRNGNILYGGSVNHEDVKTYTSLDNINGALVGSESLNAKAFVDLIKNAS